MEIQDYLDSLLNSGLKEIKYRYREIIVADIRDRMCALLSRWDEEAFRRTVLFVTDEEALFYEPVADDNVRRFVVASIRNSMLEVAASVNCDRFKMQEPLPNETIRSITSNAILYFKQCEFNTLKQETKTIKYTDVYEEAIQKYPLAWEVLKKAALMENEELIFEEAQKTHFINIDGALVNEGNRIAVCDGYSLEFDDYLKEEIGKIITGEIDVFYADCFKMLSRNFEKILHVLQIILDHDKAFVTCNYYISNGLIEKRKKILRAAHNGKEDMFRNMRNRKGAPLQLRQVLNGMVTGG